MRGLSWTRCAPVFLALMLPSLVLARRARPEVLPTHEPLASFPNQIGGLQAHDLALSQDELQVLGPGDFLLRDYSGPLVPSPLNLYIAFFPSQRSGDTIHSPKNCLPGSGWVPLKSQRILLKGSSGSPVAVERYLIGRGADRDVVLYWYEAHGRITPSEYWAKILLVRDAIRLNRTDGALVRVVAPIAPGGSPDQAEKGARQFAETILPILGSYIPN